MQVTPPFKTSIGQVWLAFIFSCGFAGKNIQASTTCQLSDFSGTYVGLDNGFIKSAGRSSPSARLYQEKWAADGTVVGTIWERQGKKFSSYSYQGQIRLNADCSGEVYRYLPKGILKSAIVASPDTHQSFSVDLVKGNTVSGTITPQMAGVCSESTLKGTVLSNQTGYSLLKGDWKPNTVIQREEHDGQAGVTGLAISSYNGKPEKAVYTGKFQIREDCTGTLEEVDSQGVHYHYRAIMLASGKGYFYLQTDPKDLTGAFLGISQ